MAAGPAAKKAKVGLGGSEGVACQKWKWLHSSSQSQSLLQIQYYVLVSRGREYERERRAPENGDNKSYFILKMF